MRTSVNTKDQNILVCGSMVHVKAMMYYSEQLGQRGIPAFVPKDEQAIAELSREAFLEEKNHLSRIWLKNIASASTFGILVVNERKREIDNYIGANTFAEIAVAFNASKRIFLLHKIFPPYEDELVAWKARPLYGDLEKLVSEYFQVQLEKEKEKEKSPKSQLILPHVK